MEYRTAMDDPERILCVLARADREMTPTEIIDHDSRLTRFTLARHLKKMDFEGLVTLRIERNGRGGPAGRFFKITHKGREKVLNLT